MTDASPARLLMSGVSKTFGAHRVLDGVELRVAPGEIRGVAGQNGSGKSTLIKILTGIYPPDAGSTISVDNTMIRTPVRWSAISAAGVSVVHQDLGLLDGLSVAENVCVGAFPTTRIGRIDRRARDSLTVDTLARLGLALRPETLVGSLAAAERAAVAIARALRDHTPGKGLLVLDESTRSLRGDDLARVHALLRRIVAQGSSVILVSHSLHELASMTHAVTVLRDGRVAADLREAEAISEQAVARAMLGSSVQRFKRSAATTRTTTSPFLRVDGMQGRQARDVTFCMDRGEVLGITGVPGSGYDEIPLLLAGVARPVGGTLTIGKVSFDLRRHGVTKALRSGIMLVPERRAQDGLAFDLSVEDNVVLPQLRARHRPLFLSRKWKRAQADKAILEFGVRPANPDALVRQLSGGNQQKALLAKWMTMAPVLLILHEPTQAVDVGARHDILRKVSGAARDGTSVIVVSSEAEDLVAVCDRVLTYRPDGGLSAGDATDAGTLLSQMFSPEPVAGGS